MTQRDKVIKRVTWIGVFLNLLLTTLKLLFSIIGNSYALLSDGIHSLSDLITDFGILIGMKYWNKPPDKEHPYGHYRIEIIVTGGIGLFLMILSFGIFANAVQNLKRDDQVTPNIYAFAAALISIIVKELLFRYTKKSGEAVGAVPLIANAWHHRSDALSSIPAALAILLAQVIPEASYIDSIGGMIVSIFIFIPAIRIMKPAIDKLIDHGASPELLEEITQKSMAIKGVLGIHDIRTRYLTNTDLALELHVEVDGELSVTEGHNIGKRLKEVILAEEKFNVQEVLIHIDSHQEYLKLQKNLSK